ncbi:hypothetical protein QZM43_32570 [Burkholderia orbicola]|uniref:DUF6900 domain-containing protein n=1 Tax=Burkholderia orbicola TaxID=2978683 RepID=UPI0026520F22|nr:hypothetical protein [Burkholderia orbicola]MDN7472609.1 hypothetical protein [Burkholderia orbicola]MDN7507479.1 hypothetical protein [Burkholderia orbicola]
MTIDELNTLLEHIAFAHIGLDSLEARGDEFYDVHEVTVDEIRAALVAAFEAGRETGREAAA